NDRADLALLAEADLVHVGQEDLPVEATRRLGLAVGLSTHSEQEIDRADADYIGVGPVYATPTKEGRLGVGLELVRYAASSGLAWSSFATRRDTPACRGSRSAGSTPGTSRTWSQPARSASR